MFERYICVKQHDMKDCAASCLATITREYGLKCSISKIREYTGTDMDGTSVLGVVTAAEKLGFTAKAVRCKKENIFNKNIPLPAIAHLLIDGKFYHYVVIHKITNKKIVVADPRKGIVTYKPEDFMEVWTNVLILMVPQPSFKTGDETTGLFKRFFGLIKVQKSLLLDVLVTSVLVTLLGIIGSFYFKFLIDDILPNNLNNSLVVVSIAMASLALFKIIAEFFRSKLMLHISQNIDIPLLLGYYNHVIDLPMDFFSKRKVGEIISRFSDAGKIRDALGEATLTLMIDVAMAVAGGIILYMQSSILFKVSFIPLVLYLILVVVFKKPLEKINRDVMEDNSKLTSYLVESLEGIETIKSFNGEKIVNFETEKKFISYIKSVFKYGYTNCLQVCLKGTVSELFEIGILAVGGGLVLKGDVTLGTLITFNSLLVYYIQPIERVINLQPQLQSALVAADRLSEILDVEKEMDFNEDKKINPASLYGDISLKNINFRYGTRQLILKDINMDIKKGEKIALVGESGSGKTTIAKLIMEFFQPESGEILINSYNIKDINRRLLREKISYISQDAFFFSGTIKENLEFANKEASYEEIIEACKKAQINDYINSLPLRYGTVLEEKASNLSGGQRQRLAIARALVKKPDILIMDEATSNLDTITERAIESTIKECTKDVTTIIIAHRLSTIMNCDKIYVIDNGQVIEEGTHEELIRKSGYYYRLWNGQTCKSDNEGAKEVDKVEV